MIVCFSFIQAIFNYRYFTAKNHATEGPNKVSDLPYTTLAEAFLKAVKLLGFSILDLNSEFNTGKVCLDKTYYI